MKCPICDRPWNVPPFDFQTITMLICRCTTVLVLTPNGLREPTAGEVLELCPHVFEQIKWAREAMARALRREQGGAI